MEKIFDEPYRSSLKEIIEKTRYNYTIIELEIQKDHIHMIVRVKSGLSSSEIMQIIKSISAREFFRRYPEMKKRYFWSEKIWTQSYFVETIGNANDELIRQYVRDQLEQMDKLEMKAVQLGLF